MKISFVVLHYLTLNDTKECINSILNNVIYDNLEIIVVDNGSANGSGELLTEEYLGNKKVFVIQNESNLGFAKGNNLGFKYAKYERKSDFIILINNDTLIEQAGFCEKVIEVYNREKYTVCGPNIISLIDGEQQNPIPRLFTNKRQVQKKQMKFKVLLSLNYIGLDLLIVKLKDKKYQKKKKMNKLSYDDIQIHGSCLIFSTDYIKKYEGLTEQTFMYMEEDILKYIIERDHFKMIYSDEMTIFHKEDSSTNSYLKNEHKKRRFYYKNSIKSCRVLVNIMNEA